MPRYRTIKPEFWVNAQVLECSIETRLFFIGLWNFCDDEGRHQVSLKQLKAEIFPSEDFNSTTIRRMIDELSENALIQLYFYDEIEYLQVTGWHHQKIDKKSSSKIPSPLEGRLKSSAQDDSTNIRRTFDERSALERNREEKNIEEKSKPKKKTDLVVPIENFELTQEVIEWGETQPQKWTSGEMQMHFDYFRNYLKNRTAKPYKDLKAAFRNAVIGNYAKLRQYQHQPNKTKLDVIKERNKAVLEASLLGDEENYEQLQRLD